MKLHQLAAFGVFLSVPVSNASMAQSEERGSKELEAQQADAETGIYRKNGWEPFLGAGVISTVSSVKSHGSDGESVEFAVGLLFVTGFKYFFNRNWAAELKFGYEYVPKGTSTEHAFADTYQGAYFF